MWRTIARLFEEDNPDIRVKLEWVVGDYGQKLPLLMISDTAADAILMDDENYPAYAVRSYLEDLHPYIARQSDDIERLLARELGMDGSQLSEDERDIFASSIESFTYRGHFGALPWDGFPMLMFYNKDLFDEVGLDYPDPDWTWDDFRAMSKTLTRDKDGDGYTDTWGANIGFVWLGIQPLVWSYGGRFLTPDRTRAAVMSPETLAAARLLYDMKHVDHSMPHMTDVQDLLGEVQLLTGRVAMVTAGLYTIFALEAVPPEDAMRWGVAHSPKGPGGERYTRVSWDGISINSATTPEKKEAAWKFSKFLLTEEAQRVIAESGRGMPARKSCVTKYFVKEPNIEYKELAVEAIGYGRLTPITPKYLELRQAMDTEFDPLNQDKNPPPVEVAFARMEPKINKILAEELARWGDGEQLDSETIAQVPPLRFFLTTLAGVVFMISPVLLIARVRRFIRLRLHETLHMARGRMARVEAFHGILFASPWLIGLLCFTAGPIIFSIVLSFSRWDTLEHVDKISFIGFANFRKALSADPVTGDPLVRKALWNTFYYAAFAVPLG
ncbi:MAG: extracellular solute-binding protein, partial [Candidatus Hydrogenedentes bacterium]|nr:extracellular solute-binding protein [Candidatus Hydrogenedentota bacterium]